jgi:hypothetical protein
MGGSGTQRRQLVALGAVVLGTLAVPLGLRAVNAAVQPPGGAPSYIPSIEFPRERHPFDAEAVATLREADCDYILIGDSMAGTRIDPEYLSSLVGGHGVAALFHPGSGPAYWYLTFKNFVVNARVRPRLVIFFFRDDNLTDTFFRYSRGGLDRVARDREPVLDELLAARSRGTFYRLHGAIRDLYQYDRTKAWLEPILVRAPVAWSAGRRARRRLLDRINNEVFTLEALRPMAAADMVNSSGEALDFDRMLPTSVLPEILRLSKMSRIGVAFVRVQRRPTAAGPPPQSPEMREYVRELRAYLVANGAIYRDDWGDPDQPLSVYEDGDHVKREFRRIYTELFLRRNPEIFR